MMIVKSKTFEEKYEISDEEKKALIKLIAYRYIDFVTEAAFECAEEALNSVWEKTTVYNDDTLSITFKCEQVVADILVELGRYRREKEK